MASTFETIATFVEHILSGPTVAPLSATDQQNEGLTDGGANWRRFRGERALRLEVPEWLRHDPRIEIVLDQTAVCNAVRVLRDAGVEAVAVCFLYSFLDPTLGVSATPYLTQSNGGVIDFDTAARLPVRTVLSGPSTGVMGAQVTARLAGAQGIITFDMGGTSTDVALMQEGEARLAREAVVHGYPIKAPMSTSIRSAPAAARSRLSTPADCSRSGRAAPAPIRGRPATAAATTSRRSPMLTSSCRP